MSLTVEENKALIEEVLKAYPEKTAKKRAQAATRASRKRHADSVTPALRSAHLDKNREDKIKNLCDGIFIRLDASKVLNELENKFIKIIGS